jgi:hypothetical protein
MTLLSGAILHALYRVMAETQASSVAQQQTLSQATPSQPVVTHL